jgi:hypothetical protein
VRHGATSTASSPATTASACSPSSCARESPDKKALAWDLYEQGFFPPPRKRFNNDVRGVVTYIWNKWFDRIPASQSNAISPDQHSAPQPALPGFDPRPETEETKNA